MSIGGLASGTKFTLIFDVVTDKAKKELGAFKKEMASLASTAGKGGGGGSKGPSVGGGLEEATSKASGLSGALGMASSAAGGIGMAIAGAGMALDMMTENAAKLVQIGQTGLGGFAQLTQMIMGQLSPVEASMNRLMQVGKKTKAEANAIVDMAEDIVVFTPYQEAQVMGITESLAMAKVNMDAFKDSSGKAMTLNDAVAQGFSRIDENAAKMAGSMQLNATTALLDLAAATGQVGEQMDFFVNGMKRALQTGNTMMLLDQMAPKIRKAVFETEGGKMTISAQKAMQNLFKYLQKEGLVGAAAAASATFDGIKSNFGDLPKIFAKAIGGRPGEGGIYDQIKESFAGAFENIVTILNDPEFTASLRSAFEPAFAGIVKGIKLVGKAAGAVLAFIKDNPGTTKFILTLVAVGSVLAVVAGGLLALAPMWIGFNVAVAMAVVSVIPFMVVMGALAPMFAGIAAGAYLLYRAFDENIGGMKDIAMGVVAFVGGMKEAFEDWGNETTSISEETGSALKKGGLFDFFIETMAWLKRAEHAWNGFWPKISAAGSAAWDKLAGPMFRAMEAGEKVMNAFKNVLIVFGLWEEATDVSTNDAENFGESWGDNIARIIDLAATIGVTFLKAGAQALLTIAGVANVLGILYSETAILTNKVGILFTVIGAAAETIVDVIMLPFNMLQGMLTNTIQAIKHAISGDYAAAMSSMGKAVVGSTAGMVDGILDRFNKAKTDIAEDTKDISEHEGRLADLRRSIAEGKSGERGYRSGESTGPRKRALSTDELYGPGGGATGLGAIDALMSKAYDTSLKGGGPPAGFNPPPINIQSKADVTLEIDGQVLAKVLKDLSATDAQAGFGGY